MPSVPLQLSTLTNSPVNHVSHFIHGIEIPSLRPSSIATPTDAAPHTHPLRPTASCSHFYPATSRPFPKKQYAQINPHLVLSVDYQLKEYISLATQIPTMQLHNHDNVEVMNQLDEAINRKRGVLFEMIQGNLGNQGKKQRVRGRIRNTESIRVPIPHEQPSEKGPSWKSKHDTTFGEDCLASVANYMILNPFNTRWNALKNGDDIDPLDMRFAPEYKDALSKMVAYAIMCTDSDDDSFCVTGQFFDLLYIVCERVGVLFLLLSCIYPTAVRRGEWHLCNLSDRQVTQQRKRPVGSHGSSCARWRLARSYQYFPAVLTGAHTEEVRQPGTICETQSSLQSEARTGTCEMTPIFPPLFTTQTRRLLFYLTALGTLRQ